MSNLIRPGTQTLRCSCLLALLQQRSTPHEVGPRGRAALAVLPEVHFFLSAGEHQSRCDLPCKLISNQLRRRRPKRLLTAPVMPPLGDGDAVGEAGDGDDPVTDETADDTGEVTDETAEVTGDVTDDKGDDSAGAGPTPPATKDLYAYNKP